MMKKHKIIFVGIAILIILGLLCRYMLFSSGYVTITTSLNGEVEEYFVKSYKEKDGCVIFVDIFGFEKKFCGFYTITKLNENK